MEKDAMDSSQHEKGSSSSIGSVLDSYVMKNWGGFGNSYGLFRFNGNLEVNPCIETINGVLLNDDVHSLPMVPSGMKIESTAATISDWIEDFEHGLQLEDGKFEVDETCNNIGETLHYLGVSCFWDDMENSQPEKGGTEGNKESVSGDVFNKCNFFDATHNVGVVTDKNVVGFQSVGHSKNLVSINSEVEESQNCSKNESGVPHDALFFVLGYLCVKDLLSVELVCRSFRDAVRGDPLLWRTVRIDQPLNERITNDRLVELTSRAQGSLQCLILVNCLWITDIGLGLVLQRNPRLIKLSVPDCFRLTIEGILINLRAVKSSGASNIKHLRVGGLAGVCHVTHPQFEELKELLDANTHLQQRDKKPQIYRAEYSHIICEDDRAIDIEVCPRCQKLRPVYDCPAESCQMKHQAPNTCRGCTICIPRCICCGRCIKDFDYEETFFLDLLCLNCLKCTIICQYEFCLYG